LYRYLLDVCAISLCGMPDSLDSDNLQVRCWIISQLDSSAEDDSRPVAPMGSASRSVLSCVIAKQHGIRVQGGFALCCRLVSITDLHIQVPVPIHIIFRSGGLCVSMIVGWLAAKKRYSGAQVVSCDQSYPTMSARVVDELSWLSLQISVILVTVGIIVATASTPPKPKGRPPTIQANRSGAKIGLPDHIQYVIGVGLLSLALVISAFMGLFQEKTYARYGRGGAVWQESIFYSVRDSDR
jgi:hypothetical protein